MIDLKKLADSYYIEREQNHVRFTHFNFQYYLKRIKHYIEGLMFFSGVVGYIIGSIITIIICHFIRG